MPLDPQLQALKDSLNGAISGGQLVLNEQNMNGASSLPVVALFQEAFGLDAITIGGTISIVPDGVNNLLRVSGTGVTTLYNLAGTAVALTFGSATPPTTLTCYGTITPPSPATWKFSDSFPPLNQTYFNSLLFTNPRFTISTYAVYDTSLKVTLVAGGALFIQPSGLTGPLEPLLDLHPTLPTPLAPFYGPVVEQGTMLQIALSMPFSDTTIQVVNFPSLFFPRPNVVLRCESNTAQPPLLSALIAVEADVDFAGMMTLPMYIGVPSETRWSAGFVPGVPVAVPDLASFLSSFSGADLTALLPLSFLTLDGFYLTTLWTWFNLETGVSQFWGIGVATAPEGVTAAPTVWTIIPGVIELTALTADLVVRINQPGGAGPADTMYDGGVSGKFNVGGTVNVRVEIPIPITGDWVIASASQVALPSVNDLSKLVAGVDLATLLPSGVADIGAFSIRQLTLVLNPTSMVFQSFYFSLISTNPWTIISNQLVIQSVRFDFKIVDPFGTRALSGLIQGTLLIGTSEVNVVVDRQPFEIAWLMQIWSEEIALPTIEDLDELIGTSIAPYLPSTIATLSFVITNLNIALNLTETKILQIAFNLTCTTEWTIIPNVLVVKTAGITVNLSWYTGAMLTEFGIAGALQVVGKNVDVGAMRDSDGNWTFRGELAEGETIDLAGMVAQFLGINPAYMPVSMSIEGIVVQFTTNDSSFLVAGRTAGFWTYEVSSALTLQMRAAAQFQRNAAGESSGYLTGEFRINNLQINVSYQFDSTSSTFIFQIIYKRFSLSAALTSGKDAKGNEYSLLKFTMGDLTLGEILEWLVNLASPGSDFKLSAPWDVLNQINFKNLSLIVDLKTWDVTVNYAIDINLVFIHLTGIGLKYSDAGGEGSVFLQLSGSFLGQEYSLEKHNPLEWDVLNEPAPDVPASGPTLIDLKYVGLGQQVAFSDISELDTVGQVIAAMRAEMQEVNDGSRNPLATGNGSLMRFDRSSHLLLGADFEILETVSLAFIFNDPYIYGLRLGLAGSRAGSMAGLQFELLYKKITNDIGVFKVELRVPDAFRQWEFGAVSITLPVIKVDIYTNGNFRVDLGFPKDTDFSDSFAIQVFPFIGFGGFYFAYLTGATSETVPAISNGTFAPVIELGIGLSIGLGKEIRKGPLSGGIYVTVIGILEGTVAWFTPDNKAAADGTFYRISGMIGIVGKVYGKVDFAVIKVSVSLTARLTVRLTLEAYQATTVQVTVEVEASATVTIFWIDIDFSFTVKLDEKFVIGSPSKTPWLVAPKGSGGGSTLSQPRLRGQQTSYLPPNAVSAFRSQAYSDRQIAARALGRVNDTLAWTPVLVFPAKKTFAMTLVPALTVATQSGTTAVQLDFALLLENSIAPGAQTREERRVVTAAHSSRADDPADLAFNLLVQLMFLWTTNSVLGRMTGNVTAADLDAIYAELLKPETFDTGFGAGNLLTLLATNFNGQMAGLPADPSGATQTSGTVFAMLPQLNYVSGATTFNFATGNLVSSAYETQIRQYYEQLLVDYEWGRAQLPGGNGSGNGFTTLTEAADGDESMATLIFRESFMILARSVFESASKALAAFVPTVPANASLNSLAGSFPKVAGTYKVHEGDTVESIAAMFGMTVAGLQALNNGSLRNPLTPGTSVNVQIAVTAESIAWANRNAALNVPAAPAPAIKLPLSNVLYQAASGESLSAIATEFNIATVASIAQIAVNSANRQLLAAGATMTIAQPAAPAYNWFAYTSVAGDNLQRIAVWAYVRTAGTDPQPNGAWYSQTIVNFNTDPQNPYAGPDLAGVIATGTTLKVPKALNDSNVAHAIQYVTRAGDTLTFVTGYFDVIQNAPSSLAAIESGLQSLNPGLDWNNLPTGTAIKVPAQTYPVAAGDSLDSIAARFLIAAPDLAAGTNAASTTLLAALAVLALPDFDYTVVTGDTLQKVATKFNLAIAELAGEVADVQSIFASPADPPLVVPEVPSYPIAQLCSILITGSYANEAAMAVSRFLASGLRLPVQGDDSTLVSLYVATGQQLVCPTPPATITFKRNAGVTWFDFVSSFTASGDTLTDADHARHPRLRQLNPALEIDGIVPRGRILLGDTLTELPFNITQDLLTGYAPSTTFDPDVVSGPSPLDIKQQNEVTWRLFRSVHWQAGSSIAYAGGVTTPSAGEPAVWSFSDALLARAAAVGYGTAAFGLFTQAGDPAVDQSTSAVAAYDWAATINLYVRQVSAPNADAPLPTTYELAGSDQAGKAILLALLEYLTGGGSSDTATIYILYPPNADNNNNKGVASGAIDPARTFLVKTNLSTVTTSGPVSAAALGAPKPVLYQASIAYATDFIQLLWEGCITASGGYLFSYTDTAGKGLPNEVFAATPLGALQLIVILGSQSRSSSPDRTLHAFNNCAVAGDNIDASQQTVFVAVADKTKAEYTQSAAIPPGNLGFELTRTKPTPAVTPDAAKLRTQLLYSLLAYQSHPGGGFQAGNEGLPVSPAVPDSGNAAIWDYKQVLSLARLTASSLPATTFLPSAAGDPYAGIAPGAQLTLDFAFHDLYGNNITPSTALTNLDANVGYYDDVVGLASWPGITLAYDVAGTAAAPQLALKASLQASNYVPGSGTTFDAAQQNASAHRVRYEAIYYQVWQSGLSLKLTTSLIPPGVTPGELPLDLIRFARFASASYLFIDTALLVARSTVTATSTSTLKTIAQQYTTDPALLAEAIASLGVANEDVPTVSLFSASIVMPELYTSAYGDTLTAIVDKTKLNDVPITVVQLATQNQNVPLNAGTDVVAPQRTSASTTTQDSFDIIAAAMKADVGALAIANQSTRGLLTLDFPLTVQDVTVHVALDPASQETQSLGDLVPVFFAQAVNTTASAIAVANAGRTGIFNSGKTLLVDDYVLQAGDTFVSLAAAYSQFTISALATAAKDSPNLWGAGLPLLIRYGTPLPVSMTETLKTISNVYGITVEELALANQTTPLVTGAAVFVPDRVTIDAANPNALAPYTVPADGRSVDDIVTTFGETGATAFMTRNWQLRWIFIPDQPVTVGTANDRTKANDSFKTLYDRLKAKDPAIDQALYISTISPNRTLLTAGALFAAVLPSTGGATTKLSTLAAAFSSGATVIAQVNSSMSGFLVSGATVTLGAFSLVTDPGETFTSLVSRFRLKYGVQTTVAELAARNATQDLVAAGQRFLLGPAPVSQTVTLPLPVTGKPYATNPFRATVTVTLKRDDDRIDPQFTGVASVKSSSSLIAPLTTPPNDGTSAAISLQTFAAAFEAVFPHLKVAVGGDASQGGGTRDIWCVDFSADGIASVDIDGQSPSFFGIPPIANSLQDLNGVPIQHYDPATGKLVPETGAPTLDFQAVDLDVWAATCLAAIEQVLSPGYAPPAFRINPAALNQLIAAKQSLATNISASVISILQGSTGNAADASAQLEQALLASLNRGFATNTIVQYPVTVASKYTSPTYDAENAPRLIGKLVDVTYRTAAKDDLNTVATFYQVPPAAMAMLLGQTIRILATGTQVAFKGAPYTLVEGETIDALMLRVGATSYQDFVANLSTPNGFFLPYTVLNTDLVTGTTGDAGTTAALITFTSLADYYHMPLALLATNIETTTGLFVAGTTLEVPGHPSIVIGSTNNSLRLAAAAMNFVQPYELAVAMELQANKLDPAFPVRFVRLVPQHELTGAKVSLFSGSSTLNVLFNVKSESRAKNMFLRLDGHLNEFEYDVHDVVAGYQASSWLSFVIPLSGGEGDGQPVDTALGEVLIPIPLRAYPLLPSMAEQTGLAPEGDPSNVTDAKKWNYTFTYRMQEAAQDTLYLQVKFNNAVAGDLGAALNVASLGPQLAQFVAAWPEVNTALAALLTWNGSPNPVLAQTVQTFADLATRVAGAWTAFLFAKAAATAAMTYDYRIDFTTRSGADGMLDHRQSILLTVLGQTTPTPVASAYPAIEWRPVSGGDWEPLELQSTTNTPPYRGLYVYQEDVPATEPIEHRMSIDGLDVVAWQNAIAAARITRNEHLVSTATTSGPFVYNTGFIGFPAPLVPFVQHENLIPFNDGLDREAALEALFTALLGTSSPASYFLKTGIEFGYEIVITAAPAQPIASFLPVAFLPTSQYAATLPAAINAQIAQWSTGKPFSATQGLYSLDITVFTTLTTASASKVPILRLNHLVYDNSGGGSDSFSDRLSIAQLRRRAVIAMKLERDRQRLAATARAPDR
jgi:LysM repeat protein